MVSSWVVVGKAHEHQVGKELHSAAYLEHHTHALLNDVVKAWSVYDALSSSFLVYTCFDQS